MVREWRDGDYEHGDDSDEESERERRAPGKLSRTTQAVRARRALDTAATSSARPLPGNLATPFGASLGTDVSGVRVHDDDAAAKAAGAVSAKAFATGDDIYFNKGQYQPDSASGRELLAHEVAHTVQQRGGAGLSARFEISDRSDPLEHEADALAQDMIVGRPTRHSISAGAGIARTPEDGEDGEQAGGDADTTSGPWTEQSIIALCNRPPEEMWPAIAGRDTRNAIEILVRLARFQTEVRQIPSGASCPPAVRQAMYQIVHARALDHREVRGFFHARFGIAYQRVFNAGQDGQDTQATPDQDAEFRGDVDFDVLDRVWWQLDRLPDADVSENSGMRIFRMAREGLPGAALGTHDPDADVVTIAEDSAYEDDPDSSTSLEGIVRHEVGHAVYDRMGGRAEAWVRDVVRSTFEDISETAVRNVITGFGGFPATFESNGAQEPFTPALQSELISRIHAYISSPSGNFVALEGTLLHASWALPEGVMGTFMRAADSHITNRSADLAGFRHAFSAHYAKLVHSGPLVSEMIAATGREYAGKAPYEFFAECYVEYYGDPASVNDPSLRGGSLPGTIKSWFDGNVSPPTAADAGRSPETGGAGSGAAS